MMGNRWVLPRTTENLQNFPLAFLAHFALFAVKGFFTILIRYSPLIKQEQNHKQGQAACHFCKLTRQVSASTSKLKYFVPQ